MITLDVTENVIDDGTDLTFSKISKNPENEEYYYITGYNF